MKESYLKPLPTDDELAHLIRSGNHYRRIAGVVIGAMLGLVYGVVSQMAVLSYNRIVWAAGS
jgi:hypothetical protein